MQIAIPTRAICWNSFLNSVDDARGNAEALLTMKDTMDLKISFD